MRVLPLLVLLLGTTSGCGLLTTTCGGAVATDDGGGGSDAASVEGPGADGQALDRAASDVQLPADGAAPDTSTLSDASAIDTAVTADAVGQDAGPGLDAAVGDAAAIDTAAAADAGPSADAAAPDTARADLGALDLAAPDLATADTPGPDTSPADIGTSYQDAAARDGLILPSTPCGTVSALADDFDDGVAGQQWHVEACSHTSAEETEGQLVFTLPSQTTGSHEASYSALFATYLDGDAVTVHLAQAANLQSGAEAGLSFTSTEEDSYLAIYQRGDQLCCDVELRAGSSSTCDNFVPAEQSWWRIAESAGLVTLETSAGGGGWSECGSGTIMAGGLLGTVALWALTYQYESNPGEVHFDDLCQNNAVSWCRPHRFSDNFDDALLAREWYVDYDPSCQVVETNGELTVQATLSYGDNCGVETWPGYALADGAVWVEVVDHPGHDGVAAGLVLMGLDFYVEYGLAGDRVVTWTSLADFYPNDWSAAGRSWLRLRQQGFRLFWDASSNGADWETLHFEDVPQLLDPFWVRVNMGHIDGHSLGGLEQPATAKFDNYNVGRYSP